jgi:Holliday junction resolvase RusA-like endonuclease
MPKIHEEERDGIKWIFLEDPEEEEQQQVQPKRPSLPIKAKPLKPVTNKEVFHKSYSDWRYYAIPFAPLSHNNAYGSSKGGRRFKIKEYDEYSSTITELIRMIDDQNDEIKLYGDAYEVMIAGIFRRDALFYNKGSLKKFDVDGFIKLIQDAVFEYLKCDDSTVLKVTSYKVEMNHLPWEEKRFTENPTWGERGGVFSIGIRTVPVQRIREIKREDDPQLSEMISKAVQLEGYQEPRLNMNRGKKAQARKMDRRKPAVRNANARKKRKR